MSAVHLHPEDLLDLERAGSLADGDRARLEAHLAVCRACAAERALYSALELELAPQAEDDQIVARATALALAEDARPPREARSPARSPWARPAVAISVAAAALAVFLATRPESTSSVTIAREHPTTTRPPSSPERAPDPATRRSVPAEREPSGEPARAVPTRGVAPMPAPLESPPSTDSVGLFQRANEARRSGRTDDAVSGYEALIARHGGSREAATARVALGRMQLDVLGHPGEALPLFDAYLASAPGGTLAEEARVGRALALGRLGRVADERAAWTDVLEKHPTSVHADRARDRLRELEAR